MRRSILGGVLCVVCVGGQLGLPCEASADADPAFNKKYRPKVEALAPKLDAKAKASWVESTLALLREWSRGKDADAEMILDPLKLAVMREAAQKATGVVLLVDTSSSMKNAPAGGGGGGGAKIDGAEKSAIAAIKRLKALAAKHSGIKLHAGVYTFSHQIRAVIPLQRVTARFPTLSALRADGATAIGDAMVRARRDLCAAGIARQHIIVITDGSNTHGRSPLDVLRAFNMLPGTQFPQVHLIAFDIATSVFRPLQRLFLGKVHQARDSAQLDAVLARLLERDILPEATGK